MSCLLCVQMGPSGNAYGDDGPYGWPQGCTKREQVLHLHPKLLKNSINNILFNEWYICIELSLYERKYLRSKHEVTLELA